ncbi:MAG: 30S ribosomal protein S16 [Deltaproteobacteria bacterium]|nr:30S ribosomal protein S16 [Deltaproteobacteria bacterium]MCD6138554.1 30S ribosomal protein S16 [Deltaproteobacteria bacterium]RLB91155.1 MAG: 30S ribosomal protein S16 [Deltaproteobacteria bacterium]RLB96334.1 MAG: 30S ribosomal protein S16 [Deltaproteobacteria bacterium]RLC12326.1 MAG: 30S ribosomal protein S16 [Deltaproteobacteria bacterium]
MGVKIRLARYGTKKKPFYRLVAAPSRAPRDGKFLELLGTYDPLKEPAAVNLKHDRIKSWIEKGALPTATVKSLLRREGYFSKTTSA